MRTIRRLVLICGVLATAALLLACGSNGTEELPATSTQQPIPSPVEFEQEPQGAERGDPSFEALPGAQALFGQLGGSIYQIEMPDDWNGRLVLYLHGFRNFGPTLTVDPPGIRSYLIRHGFAWGASSYSNNGLVPALGADETAALWDLFVQKFGRPERTYVTGHSMGGGAIAISAERYPERYDGALSLCGIAGNTPMLTFLGDFFVAAAFVSDATQSDFDSSSAADVPAGEFIQARILPALEDTAVLDRLLAVVIDLTGGPRPFDQQGVLRRIAPNLEFAATVIGTGLFNNRDTVYRLGPLSDVSSEEFNDAAIRLSAGGPLEAVTAGHEISGDIQMPLLTLHTTGDQFVPISAQQVLRQAVEAAGKGDLLIQRAVRAAPHCAFTNAEWETALEDLIGWVEDGVKPEGEDLLRDDLSDLGETFTLAPRLGSPEADAVPGADERLTLSGRLTLDGEPLDGWLARIIVRRDGLQHVCNFHWLSVSDGHYEVTVAGEGEVRGCGAPGAEIYLVARSEEDRFVSQEIADWPVDGAELTFDATFSSEDPDGVGKPITTFTGAVLDNSDDRLPVGTIIEAYIGDTLCGVASLPPVVMAFADPGAYDLIVAGPDSVPGCDEGEEISFRVDGEAAEQTATNDLAEEPHELDLTLP